MTNQQHIQTNVVQFYSNLESFRIRGKYTDLRIECDGSYFECHRLTLASASQFFDSMFADTFRERKEEYLLIREVDAATLAEVLQFIYTGDATVTSENICNLFKGSKLFELSGIADLCLEFVKNNRMTVNTTLSLYSLARQDMNEMLVDVLSQGIADQFKIFARAKKFLEIPFNDLKIILDKLSPKENEEASLGFIIRWFFHSRKERSLNFDQFYRMTNFGNISIEVAKFLTSKLYKDQDSPELSVETVDPVGYDEFVAMPRTISSDLSSIKKLHLFVGQTAENPIKIFSIDEDSKCENSGEVHLKDVPQWIQTIALDDHLYCLHYVRRHSKKQNNQKFRVYTSVNMDSFMELNALPLIFGDVNLCRGQNNNIYAYNQTPFEQLKKTGSRCSMMFSDEEMNRGIYVYNADLDIWLPVPAMQKKVEDACMTTHDGLLYLVGGINYHSIDYTPATFVQTYDYREGKWRVLSSTNYNRIGADCCVLDGIIFVCGGRQQVNTAEIYIPTLGRWYNLEKQMSVEMKYHRVINYNHKLWAVGSFTTGSTSVNNLSIQDYPNEITSEEQCPGCVFCSSVFYTDRNGHYPHTISSSSADNWIERNMLQDLKNSEVTAAILDGVVF